MDRRRNPSATAIAEILQAGDRLHVWPEALDPGLRRRHMLLLTATPVQNRLEDVFNLITALRPGFLSTARSFRDRFEAKAGIVPKNLDRLHEILGDVMVRNRRSQAGVRFTRRFATTLEVALPSPRRRCTPT